MSTLSELTDDMDTTTTKKLDLGPGRYMDYIYLLCVNVINTSKKVMTHANLYVSIFVYTIKDFLEFSAVSSLDFLHNIFKSLPT